MKSGFTPSGLGEFVDSAVRRWSPTPLCDTCHSVILWFVQHRKTVIDSRVSLCRLTSLTEIFASCARFARCYMSLSCHFHTLLPFTCADDSCVSLPCTRAAISTILTFADQPFFWVKLPSERLHSCSCSSLFIDLALCLVASGHASTQTCVH